MAEDENSWVFDSLVCFLKGPIWDAPIQNFIEEKSLIFEPNDDENQEEYHKIFDEYKNLVDYMLGNFMEDIGIKPAQFEYACFKSRQQHHSLRFDQIKLAYYENDSSSLNFGDLSQKFSKSLDIGLIYVTIPTQKNIGVTSYISQMKGLL